MGFKRFLKSLNFKKILIILYIILLGLNSFGLFMVISFVNNLDSMSLNFYKDKSSSFAKVAQLSFDYDKTKLKSLESFTYEQLVTSNYNKQYENTLRPLMNKYDIVRVYAFRLLESNELYVDPFTPNADPYDIKITLESVNDERVRQVRYEVYDEVYRHNRSDEELRTAYLERKDFTRRERTSFNEYFITYSPLYDDNGDFVAYLGVEVSLSSYYANMSKVKSVVIGISIVVGFTLIVILAIIMNSYRIDQSKRILEQTSFKDTNTGLYNRFIRRKLDKILGKDTEVKYAFILLDIDEMAKHNATYGRKNGDILIKYVASVVKNQLRGEFDIPIYLGEDDFVIIVKENIVDNVVRICKRIIDDMQLFKMFDADLSIGITLSDINELMNNFNSAFARADAAIYEARTLPAGEYQIAVKLKSEVSDKDVLL